MFLKPANSNTKNDIKKKIKNVMEHREEKESLKVY